MIGLGFLAVCWCGAVLNTWIAVTQAQAGRPAAWPAVGAVACILGVVLNARSR